MLGLGLWSGLCFGVRFRFRVRFKFLVRVRVCVGAGDSFSVLVRLVFCVVLGCV